MKINRIYFNKLWGEISEPKISILLGARQVGKSTLMRQIQVKAQNSGLDTAFYDLEQPSDLNCLAGSEEDVINEISSKAKIVFIDEFHYIKNASKLFKAIYDQHKGVKIYASGSSSLSMHKHLKESLAGRFIKTIIHPLSITEFNSIPEHTLEQYLQWGGMPGLIKLKIDNSRAELLENIVGTYITKDVKGLIKEENIRPFNSLLYILAQSQGSIAVNASLARDTGLKESTIARHLDIISETYVLHFLSSFSQNLANELKKSKKYYLFDIGVRNMLLKDFRPIHDREDKGTILESFIFLHLQLQLKPNMELRFWRTKKGDEVDFILLKNRVPIPIEVKSFLKTVNIPNGLKKFFDKYSNAPFAIVFNENLKESAKYSGRFVYFKPWTDVVNLDFMENVV